MVLNRDLREFVALLNEKNVFETCFEQREIADIGGLEISFLDIDNLITAKLNAGRPQDKVDVKKLRERKRKK